MLESFFETHDFLVSRVSVPIRRVLMDEINWNDRLIAIKGARGVGKTDFLLSYAKEYQKRYPDKKREILYINFNNFYFAAHGLYEFAGDFVKAGGKILLIDQTFKYPNWSKELRDCYFHYTNLHIVFIASSVMRLVEGNQDIGHIVKMYNLRGFSFREYLNLKTGTKLKVQALDDILQHHTQLATMLNERIDPLAYFNEYLERGYYPFCLENREFTDYLLKTMNMMLEVDVLLNKQIDVASLSKLRLLLHDVMNDAPCSLNVSKLAGAIDVSRTSVINFIKSLKDARLVNLLYNDGKNYPMKPSKVYMQNPNLCYALPTRKVGAQEVAETFFYNALHGNHKLNAVENATFLVNQKIKFDVRTTATQSHGFRYCAVSDLRVGTGKQIPLWLFGFLY